MVNIYLKSFIQFSSLFFIVHLFNYLFIHYIKINNIKYKILKNKKKIKTDEILSIANENINNRIIDEETDEDLINENQLMMTMNTDLVTSNSKT